MRFTKNIGFILLAIYLILIGIAEITGFLILPLILGILAIAAGVFILLDR